MTSNKPHVVLVPGAWHSPPHYSELLTLFNRAGFATTCLKLPSVDSSEPKDESVTKDATFIREQVLLPLIDDHGQDVLLIMHSYGGSPGAAAAKGLSKVERGSKSGIVGLVFLAAFLSREGDSLLGSLPGKKFDPWVIINEATGQLAVENPTDVFYNDVSEASLSQAIADLKPQSENALSSPSPPSAWEDSAYDGRRAYIRALQDHCIPTAAQEMMVNYSGVEWKTEEIDTSHSPFLSRPDELADMIVNIVSTFVN